MHFYNNVYLNLYFYIYLFIYLYSSIFNKNPKQSVCPKQKPATFRGCHKGAQAHNAAHTMSPR